MKHKKEDWFDKVMNDLSEITEETMKELIPKKWKHLLWKDELGDKFILLKYTEVYRFSKNYLGLYCWNPSKRIVSALKPLILYENRLSGSFHMFYVKVSNLPQLIALGAHKQRPHINGQWISNRENILGHKILPYRPELEEAELPGIPGKGGEPWKMKT